MRVHVLENYVALATKSKQSAEEALKRLMVIAATEVCVLCADPGFVSVMTLGEVTNGQGGYHSIEVSLD